MIINKPKIEEKNDKIRISSRIEVKNDKKVPSCLWFEVPKKFQDSITNRADAFVVALFLLAMKIGEDVEVKGAMSPKLLDGIGKYQKIMSSWFPDEYKIIKINCSNLVPAKRSKESGAFVAFTGGVDSFYTLLQNAPKNQVDEKKRVTHGLFINGFETKIDDPRNYLTMYNSLKEVASEVGVELIPAGTNVRKFIKNHINWSFAHGACIVATALVFQPIMPKFYIASSYTYDQIHPWGSRPDTDPLLSVENFKIIHHGASVSRVEKTIAISEHRETYDKLHACFWLDKNGLGNCCRCSKCLRTMIPLEIVGKLSEYKTFPLPLTGRKIRKGLFLHKGDKIFMEEVFEYARTKNRKDIMSNLRFAFARSWLPSVAVKFSKKFSNNNIYILKTLSWIGRKIYERK